MDILDSPSVYVKEKEKFFRLIKSGFSQRRKTINNSLSSGGFSKEQIISILQKLNIDPKLRAEDLSIEDYAKISNEL